ncbi:MAG: nitroreductase family protein [Lachnospiraceae bacterium]|nr:nitroreductase family protein [Lachnospiraceae bacterium]
MSHVFENICARRSRRSFTDQVISAEHMDLLVQAALHAPSGMNMQSRQITVVRNREKIDRLATLIREELNREGYDMYRPTALIMLSDETANTNGLADCACALQNIFLEAEDLGIASVWINQLKMICDAPKVREMLDELQIPANHTVWGMAALGYSEDVPKARVIKGVVKYVD